MDEKREAAAIYIARDGEELGALWPEELEERARAGELRPNDHYWREGMGDWRRLDELLAPEAWLPLPPKPRPKKPPVEEAPQPAKFALLNWSQIKPKLIVAASIFGAAAIVLAIAVFFITRRDGAPPVRPRSSTLDPAQANEVEKKAVADLREKIDRLPEQAAAPLNTFYYDVAVDMRRSLAPHTVFEAMIRGNEDVVDPQTEQTIRHTVFRLTSGYRDGEWIFENYSGTTKNLLDGSESQDTHDANTTAPPQVVTLLGLKIIPTEPQRH